MSIKLLCAKNLPATILTASIIVCATVLFACFTHFVTRTAGWSPAVGFASAAWLGVCALTLLHYWRYVTWDGKLTETEVRDVLCDIGHPGFITDLYTAERRDDGWVLTRKTLTDRAVDDTSIITVLDTGVTCRADIGETADDCYARALGRPTTPCESDTPTVSDSPAV